MPRSHLGLECWMLQLVLASPNSPAHLASPLHRGCRAVASSNSHLCDYARLCAGLHLQMDPSGPHWGLAAKHGKQMPGSQEPQKQEPSLNMGSTRPQLVGRGSLISLGLEG